MSARFRTALKPAAEAPPAAAPPAAPKPAKISAVLKELFATERIINKAGLDAWCGGASRDRLYAHVRERATEHWDRVANPRAAVRGAYQPLLEGYGSDSASDEDDAVRMSDRATAEAHVGRVCTYETTEGREYGRILKATASEIVLDRLSTAGGGVFVPHPVPVCPRSRNRVTYSRNVRLVEEAKPSPKASPLASSVASVGGAGSPPVTPPASPSSDALALKMATELAEVHKREIARLTAVEAEFLSLKAKLEAARLKRNEAVRAYKARAKKPAATAGAAAEPKSKDILDVFDFFPELVEELASEDPGL
jgi:hypothetical protein